MNTPSHLLIGAAVFARRGQSAVTLAALAGGLLPDVPLVSIVMWCLWVQGMSPQLVFDQLYFSESWQSLFAIDHSFFLWGGLFALARWRGLPVLAAFAGAGLLHAGVDFLLHHDDARRQLWPLTNWAFHSPVSYWDRAHYGGIMAPLEAALDLALAVLLWRRLTRAWERAIIMGLTALVLVPMGVFMVMPFPG